MLAPDGKLVFAVDALSNRCSNDDDYNISISVKTPEGFDLILKNKNYFDPKNCTQYSPEYTNYITDKSCCKAKRWIFRLIYINWERWKKCWMKSTSPRLKRIPRIRSRLPRIITAKCSFMNAAHKISAKPFFQKRIVFYIILSGQA